MTQIKDRDTNVCLLFFLSVDKTKCSKTPQLYLPKRINGLSMFRCCFVSKSKPLRSVPMSLFAKTQLHIYKSRPLQNCHPQHKCIDKPFMTAQGEQASSLGLLKYTYCRSMCLLFLFLFLSLSLSFSICKIQMHKNIAYISTKIHLPSPHIPPLL